MSTSEEPWDPPAWPGRRSPRGLGAMTDVSPGRIFVHPRGDAVVLRPPCCPDRGVPLAVPACLARRSWDSSAVPRLSPAPLPVQTIAPRWPPTAAFLSLPNAVSAAHTFLVPPVSVPHAPSNKAAAFLAYRLAKGSRAWAGSNPLLQDLPASFITRTSICPVPIIVFQVICGGLLSALLPPKATQRS